MRDECEEDHQGDERQPFDPESITGGALSILALLVGAVLFLLAALLAIGGCR